MATLKTTTFNQDGYLQLPVGTTAQRDTPSVGSMRINTDNNLLEFYSSTGWKPIVGVSKGSIGTGGNSIQYSAANYGGGGVVHMFTSTGSATFTPAFTGTVEVLVIGGGGSGGTHLGGGGGAGGFIYNRAYPVSQGTGIPITVGSYGPSPGFPNRGVPGGNSVFGSLTATGGGGGGCWDGQAALPGGSGGGACSGSNGNGSNGNTGPNDSRQRNLGGRGTSGQGFPGGSGVRYNNQGQDAHTTGGGGGAGGPGGSANDDVHGAGTNAYGGPGLACDIMGYTLYWAGGGGGACHYGDGKTCNSGGIGGGGGGNVHHQHGGPRGNPPAGLYDGVGGGNALNGGNSATGQSTGGEAGANTGAGGGGLAYNFAGGGRNAGSGAEGIVIVRY